LRIARASEEGKKLERWLETSTLAGSEEGEGRRALTNLDQDTHRQALQIGEGGRRERDHCLGGGLGRKEELPEILRNHRFWYAYCIGFKTATW
jgi:hypothetical protein